MTKASEERMKAAREVLTQYILTKHCRKTPERYALLDAAYSITGQFTVDTLQEHVAKKMMISRVTVYNNLELFVKIGLVVKHPTPGLVKYEVCYQNNTHHQLLCTVCGSSTIFLDSELSDYILKRKFLKFHSTNCSVIVYGVCSKCRARQAREKKKLNIKNTKK